ncbi:hypothetical protein J5N97_021009 [Dioscorea zingiberensis]|uniref:Protein kinase domain-containing protein n=1 Tax=Dioscorea zingiberensis TaxID=325984 RepID=A0A9D5HE67_9LILI|nr:hypothetical protein J5N97_021009 [Dioscorea zingiberensis]
MPSRETHVPPAESRGRQQDTAVTGGHAERGKSFQQLREVDARHVEYRRTKETTRGRGGRGGRGGSSHLSNRWEVLMHCDSGPSSPREMMAVPGNGHTNQSYHPSPSARHAVEDVDGNHPRLLPGSGLQDGDQTFGSIVKMVLALEYLGGSRIFNCDLKPDNVLIQDNDHRMLVESLHQDTTPIVGTTIPRHNTTCSLSTIF